MPKKNKTRTAHVLTARLAAVEALQAVLEKGRSLAEVMRDMRPRVKDADRSLFQALTYGVLRHHNALTVALETCIEKPFKPKDRDIEILLRVSVFQLLFQAIPDYAVVNEAVKATRNLKKNWASSLVNAVLREIQRNRESVQDQLRNDTRCQHEVPAWLLAHLQKDYPERWQAIAADLATPAPMTLRVNRHFITRDDYLETLREAGIHAHATALSPQGIQLEQPVGVDDLPGFEAGWVSVQDEAAQLAAELLHPQAGERILDACAAPGGKTVALLEACRDIELLSLDVDAARHERTCDYLNRCHVHAQVVTADAATPESWWDGRHFDAILLDAPCSATGVMRRHPDIRFLRRADDIRALATLQGRLLDTLWPLLKPGGRLLYATCSVLHDENDRVIEAFCQRSRARVRVPDVASGVASAWGRQLLPELNGHDGFYYALLEKDAHRAET